MDKLTVENREIDIEKQLTEYRELVRRRSMLDKRIRRTETEKNSVKPHIYDKVLGEYREALDALNQRLEPVERTVAKARDDVSTEIEESKSQMADLQDQLDELTFRHRVGEFDQGDLEQKEGPLGQQIEKLNQKIRDLETIMKRLSLDEEPLDEATVTASPEQAASPLDTLEEASPGTGRRVQFDINDLADAATDPPPEIEHIADPPAEPKRSVTAQAQGGPDATGPHGDGDGAGARDTDGRGGDKRSAGGHGADLQDFVDPSDWVGEFVDDAVSPSKNGTKNESQSTANERTTETDPLESLADPSDDPHAGEQHPTPQQFGADEPQGFPVLIITKGAGAGKRLPLLPMTMTLGREHDNNIELKDTDVSRYHARISFERGGYMIEDLEGSSGTWVNGKKIDRSPLVPGDLIKAGETEMKIELE